MIGSAGAGPRPASGKRSGALRVFLVDDHGAFRTGLRRLLEEHGLEAVGDVGDAERAIGEVVRLRPDVVLMDVSLPGISGVEATRRLVSLVPEVRILIFTASVGDESVVEAVRAGASGYLLKDAGVADVIRAVEAVAQGKGSLSPGATAVVLDRLRSYGSAPSSVPGDRPGSDLTRREREVLGRLVEGMETQDIAESLSISPNTVKNHISAILAKLEVPNRTLAAVEAVWRGLV